MGKEATVHCEVDKRPPLPGFPNHGRPLPGTLLQVLEESALRTGTGGKGLERRTERTARYKWDHHGVWGREMQLGIKNPKAENL